MLGEFHHHVGGKRLADAAWKLALGSHTEQYLPCLLHLTKIGWLDLFSVFLNTLLLRQGLPKHPVYLAHTVWRQNSLCYLQVVILLVCLLRAVGLLRAGITGVCHHARLEQCFQARELLLGIPSLGLCPYSQC